MAIPYQCSKCANWYVAIPVGPDDFCIQCDRGTHAAHPKTGVIDCHFGEKSPQPSEIGMATLLLTLEATKSKMESSRVGIEKAGSLDVVKKLLSASEGLILMVDREQAKVPDLIRWAGVFEMPGMAGSAPTARFKSTDVLEDMVMKNRRPQSDLDDMRRSIGNCNDMAEKVSEKIGEIRASLFDVRKTADAWVPPAKPIEPVYKQTKRKYTKREKVLA